MSPVQQADAERIVEMVCSYMECYGDFYEMMDSCPPDMELGECICRDAATAMGDPGMLLDWFLVEREEAAYRGWTDRAQPRLLDQIIDALGGYMAKWGC